MIRQSDVNVLMLAWPIEAIRHWQAAADRAAGFGTFPGAWKDFRGRDEGWSAAPGGARSGGRSQGWKFERSKFRYGIGPSLRRFGLPLRAVLHGCMTQDDPAHERSLILGPIARRA
jgi:hypothetical protein